MEEIFALVVSLPVFEECNQVNFIDSVEMRGLILHVFSGSPSPTFSFFNCSTSFITCSFIDLRI